MFCAGTLLGWAATPLPHLEKPLEQRQPLVVGATSDSFPHGYVDETGQVTGFAHDVLEAVVAAVDLQIETVAVPGRELHTRFRAGEFDFLQSLTQSPDREEFAEFSVPFLTMRGSIFVQKTGSPIRTLEDFNGRRFAIIGAGSILEKFIRDHALSVELVLVSSAEEALRKVDRGDCAGAFLSRLTALSVIERRGLKNVAIFDRAFDHYDIRYSFAVHRGDSVLLARLNEGLALIHKDGTYDRVYNHWFGRFDSPLITREKVIAYSVVVLSLALLAALAAYLRQRSLHRRIAEQTQTSTRQHALLQALYEHLPIGLMLFERCGPTDWKLLSINRPAATTVGIREGTDPTNTTLAELPLGEGWQEILATQLPSYDRELASHNSEQTPTGSGRRFLITSVRLPGATGTPTRVCLLIEEITARRNLEAEIAQGRKLRAVGELTGGIAHEFNNLLTPILLKADALRFELSGLPRISQDLTTIVQTAERAAELTRRLLTLSRKTDARVETLRLRAAVDSALALLRLTVDRRIVWQNSVPGELAPLYLNSTELNQILVNLILNARDTLLEKLSSPNPPQEWTPRIDIEAAEFPADHLAGRPVPTPELGWQRLTVRDNGLGIPPSAQERIFEPFYTTKDVGKGTGLGLATVWHLVNFAGGIIDVDSSPGHGTAFHVYLPINAAHPNSVPPPPLAPPPRDAGPARIVIAEDDDDVGNAVVDCLVSAGYQVHRERDGLAAWRYLSTHRTDFDLVILDINMPSLDGIEVLRRLRNREKYDGPVLVISGRIGSEEMQKLTEARVSRVLSKPFRVSELLEILRDCLNSQGRPAGAPEQKSSS